MDIVTTWGRCINDILVGRTIQCIHLLSEGQNILKMPKHVRIHCSADGANRVECEEVYRSRYMNHPDYYLTGLWYPTLGFKIASENTYGFCSAQGLSLPEFWNHITQLGKGSLPDFPIVENLDHRFDE